ncbi:MAG: 4-hydroxythreonine-4-phosphate dehydrogenase PdxA [Rhodobiaceae bacterium]|jgi:4-hydroxythreonine-4-phosphate dehydrogenase|nr:4-hydroxythreonine-4-phosphate dehydrogenase PdxA [Alphaproteobacteria bacterium]
MKPRIGIIPGDPGGIGPELIAKLLAEDGVLDQADILLIGDRHLFEMGQAQAGLEITMTDCDALTGDWSAGDWTDIDGLALHDRETIAPEEVRLAEVTLANGRSALGNLNCALEMARDGIIDAITFGPFNKAALIEAGLGHEDELHYMAEFLGIENYISELNTLNGIWTSRVSSHIPLKDVPEYISGHRITEAVHLIDRTLKRSGLARPRLSVAALNPHAGDNGNFGMEEIEVITPTVETLRQQQLNIDGPWPSDTVFLKAKAGEVDGIITMYHDQGQIALKLMGFDRGVTVQGGIPFPVTTPAHGTAFDIAGTGTADVGATRAAFDIACDMVSHWDSAA